MNEIQSRMQDTINQLVDSGAERGVRVAVYRPGEIVEPKGVDRGRDGASSGWVTVEWLESGCFLVHHVELDYFGQTIRGIEVSRL